MRKLNKEYIRSSWLEGKGRNINSKTFLHFLSSYYFIYFIALPMFFLLKEDHHKTRAGKKFRCSYHSGLEGWNKKMSLCLWLVHWLMKWNVFLWLHFCVYTICCVTNGCRYTFNKICFGLVNWPQCSDRL